MLLSSSSSANYSPITLNTSFLDEENFNDTLSHPLTPQQVEALVFYYEQDYIKHLSERRWAHPYPFCYPHSLMKVGDSLFFVVPCISLNTTESEPNIKRTLLDCLFKLCQSFNAHNKVLPQEIRILLLIHCDNTHWSALNWHLDINPAIAKQVKEIKHLVDWPGLYGPMHFYYADSSNVDLVKRQETVQRSVRYFVNHLAASFEMSKVVQHAGIALADYAVLNGFVKAIRGSYLNTVNSRVLRAWTQQILCPADKVKKSQPIPPAPLIFSGASEPSIFVRDFENSFCQSPSRKEAMVCRLNGETHAILNLGEGIFLQARPVVFLPKVKNHLSERLINWLLEILAYWLMTDQTTFPLELRTSILLYHPDARQWSALNVRFEMEESCQERYASFKEECPREELVNTQIIKSKVDSIKLANIDMQHLYPGPHYFLLPFSKISFTHILSEGFESLDDNVLLGLDSYNAFSNCIFMNHALDPSSKVLGRPSWYNVLSVSLTKSVEGVSLSAADDLSDKLGSLSLHPPRPE